MSTILDPHEPAAGWRCRYWSIFGGQTLSVIGSAMTQFVLIWWITETVGKLLHKTAIASCWRQGRGLAGDPFVSDPLRCTFDP